MIYLLNELNLDLIEFDDERFWRLDLWQTGEKKVKAWIENERCRSIFGRDEIINLFGTGKIQMVKVEKIKPNEFDKIIVWTPKGKFFVLDVIKKYK